MFALLAVCMRNLGVGVAGQLKPRMTELLGGHNTLVQLFGFYCSPPTLLQYGRRAESPACLVLCGSCQVWFLLPDPLPTSLPAPPCTSPTRAPLMFFQVTPSLPAWLSKTEGGRARARTAGCGFNRRHTGRTGVHWCEANTAAGQGLPGKLVRFFLRAHFLHLLPLWFMSSHHIPAPGTSGCPPGFSRGPQPAPPWGQQPPRAPWAVLVLGCTSLGPAATPCPLGSPGA